MIKIIVPFPKYENVKFYLEHNIDGFIIGIKKYSENFNNLISIKKLKLYCDDAISMNKEVYISLNKTYYNSDITNLKKILSLINSINVTGVIFNDLSILNIVSENKFNINLIYDGSHLSTNSKTINFLEKRGVDGVFLSNEITMKEKLEIANKINIKSYICLFGYTNMATSSRKLISNYLNYCKIDKKPTNLYYIKDKQNDNFYPIIEGDNTNFFSDKILNGIKEFANLIENKNINYVYLNDYLIDDSSFYNIIEAFVALRNYPNDKEFADKLEKVINSNCFNETNDGFLNKKTIFKVKDYE